jgi:hypothetical protein
LRGRLLVVLCTNRFRALDPAVVRRAALIETFERPSEEERRELFTLTLTGVAADGEQIDTLVAATGERDGRPAFTFSDIQTRLIGRGRPRLPGARAARRRPVGRGRPVAAFMNVEIFAGLHRGGLVVVDLTGVRPNCTMELGYALGRRRRYVISAEKGTKLPPVRPG